jgi:perosamine synthetase
MSREFLSCDGLGCSPTQMISGVLQSYSELPDWLQFEDRESIFTHQGRNAIALICQLLHIGSGDEVLVPAYNCGAELDPFVWAGAKLVFYRIDNKATIDMEDIIRRVTPSTRIVYVTHYFGWPQEIDELAKWCKDKGLLLLEDCALSLFSKGSNNTIGRVGDAAIYSFVKSLPVPDGGALVLNKDIWNETKTFRAPRHRSIILNSLPLLKKWFMHTNKFWQHYEFTRKLLNKSWLKRSLDQNSEIDREMPQNNYFDKQKIDWSISRLSKGILNTTNPDKIVEKRRRNYQYLYKALFNIPTLHPLFDDLPNNVCPLSFPALVEDRNRWCKALNANGILAYEWWAGYHQSFDWEEFPEARHLKNNLLTLPVHQSLDVGHMEYMAKCVKLIAEESHNN